MTEEIDLSWHKSILQANYLMIAGMFAHKGKKGAISIEIRKENLRVRFLPLKKCNKPLKGLVKRATARGSIPVQFSDGIAFDFSLPEGLTIEAAYEQFAARPQEFFLMSHNFDWSKKPRSSG